MIVCSHYIANNNNIERVYAMIVMNLGGSECFV